MSPAAGFTLIEIMIVVAIIALLAAVAVPSAMRARKRGQAASAMDDLRTLDGAIEQYAMENGKTTGGSWTWTDLAPYVKKGTKLYNDLSAGVSAYDPLGNVYFAHGLIDTPVAGPDTGVVAVGTQTWNALSDVLSSDYFAPYGHQ